MSVFLICYSFDAAPIDAGTWAACERALLASLPPAASAAMRHLERPGLRACVACPSIADPAPIRTDTAAKLEIVDAAEEWPAGAEWPEHEPPLALAEIDLAMASVRLRRDRLGQAPLLWARVPGGVAIASRVAPLLAHPAISRNLDERFLAAHFGLRDPPGDSTLYRDVRAVPPGGIVSLTARGETVQMSSFDPPEDAFAIADRAAASRCLHLLEQSVQRCVRPARRLGILLSPGLDSSSILALLPDMHRGGRAVAVNYGTAFGGGIDERPLAAELASRCGVRIEAFDSADYPAEIDQERFGPDPGYPFLNPYRPVKHAVYDRFEREGVDTVLTGNYGDHWASGPACGLVDALRGNRWDILLGGLGHVLRTQGLTGATRDPSIRRLGRWLLRLRPRVDVPDWVDPRWRDWLVTEERSALRRFAHWPDPSHAAYNFGTFCANDSPYEHHYSERYGFRQRHPYRDWQLLRLLVALPGHMSWRSGTSKWLVRRALEGRLPDAWRLRPKMGDLLPLLANLDSAPNRLRFETSIRHGEPIWRGFVDPAEVARRLDAARTQGFARDYLLLVLATFGTWCRLQRDSPGA